MPPDLSFWLELVFKMAMTAAVVVFISIVVERSGPFIGALIAALPTAAGAAYVILAIEHPPAFIAASAVGSMAIGAAVAIFAAVYAVLAQRHGLVLSFGLSLLAWFACAALLRQVSWTPFGALALNAAVYAVTIPLSWRYRSSAPPRKFLRTRYDIPLRAVAAATVVVIVTTASHSIGSFASGMFALFPIVFCSSIVICIRASAAKRRQASWRIRKLRSSGCRWPLWPCIISPNRSAHGGPLPSDFASRSPGAAC